MSSRDPGSRSVRLPSADLRQIAIPISRQAARGWFRVHQSNYAAKFFSLNSSHRFSHRDCSHSFLYLATDPATCLFERFGDTIYDQKMAIPNSLWQAYSLSELRVPAVRGCDLTNPRTLSALRVDVAALTSNRLETPQAWGLAIQSHPAKFQAIKFRSRFNHKVCLALFNRDASEEKVKEKLINTLAKDDLANNWLHDHKVSLY